MFLRYQLHKAWETNMTFDLLTLISKGIVYSSRFTCLPSLKLLWQSILELSVAQGEEDRHDLWPTDLNMNRDHLPIKDYLPTKFEASGAKCSWVISCTRCGRPTWPLTLTFDLLTWISIGIIYSSWTIYLASFKFMRWPDGTYIGFIPVHRQYKVQLKQNMTVPE